MGEGIIDQKDMLVGRDPILEFLKLSDWATVMKYKEKGAPISKVEGRWISFKTELSAWLRQRVSQPQG